NVAQVAGDQHDPSLSNNISPQTTTVVPGNVPPPEPPEPGGNDLFILKFVSPNPVEVNTPVTFTLVVGNNGEFGSAATVIDALPANMTFVSATASTGDPCNFNELTRQVTCDIGTVPSINEGQTVVVEVTVIPTQTGTLPNTALLANITGDPNTGNNNSIVTVNVVEAGSGNPDPPVVNPTPAPTDEPPDQGGGGPSAPSDGNGGDSGCSIAQGPVNSGNSAANLALLLLPLLVFGFRSIRKQK
ncbi:MAG: DUF11 domain-containing protein, partial [Thermodesulfobacteriota bacterium]